MSLFWWNNDKSPDVSSRLSAWSLPKAKNVWNCFPPNHPTMPRMRPCPKVYKSSTKRKERGLTFGAEDNETMSGDQRGQLHRPTRHSWEIWLCNTPRLWSLWHFNIYLHLRYRKFINLHIKHFSVNWLFRPWQPSHLWGTSAKGLNCTALRPLPEESAQAHPSKGSSSEERPATTSLWV